MAFKYITAGESYTTDQDAIDGVKRQAGSETNINIDDNLDIAPYIRQAEGKIGGYIGTRYKLPITTTTTSHAGNLLEHIALMLSSAFVILRMHEGVDNNINEIGFRIYQQEMAQLKEIKNGQLQLFDDNGVELPSTPVINQGVSGFPSTADERQNARVGGMYPGLQKNIF